MASECEGIQYGRKRNASLHAGRDESTKSNNRRKIYQKVLDPAILEWSYEQVSKKKGGNTKGIGEETLDSYSKDTILSVSRSLKDHSFRFKPIRRVGIPKPNGEKRPLGIPGPRDKVIQKAMATVLEEIYENKFSNNNHGFRPNRGTHTAIKTVTG
eukprot:CAMPEP_0174914852 /NCGR_PEP_ID=MMETSP0167-20121228/81054_1 /TAXON_ID=38298 /ORGANISM="Rhodella maculata, Strain CCMP736" /LENGTH=155 /DNA_ID=CAMNT_0016159629 /DNA_START=484 /DNA_END=951 /DNA_ORIENTATION=-